MLRCDVTITGETPLLQHFDNLSWDDTMKKLQVKPKENEKGVKGDDRSPAFRWICSLYRYKNNVVIPSDNIMTLMREGGAKCPTGKKQETFKKLTQSGLLVDQAQWDLYDPRTGKAYDVTGLEKLMKEEDFEKHQQWVAERGFELFVKRAKIGASKHVRVRPRFDHWMVSGSVTILEDRITVEVLQNIFTFGGVYSGIGDWRPSSPKSPGSFGKFSVKVSKSK